MKNSRPTAPAALFLALVALLGGGWPARAQAPADLGTLVRIETRFVGPTDGLEAGWGATGQILVPAQPSDPALQRGWPARMVATSPSRQSVTLSPGGRGLIRVGREIPFAGWFLRHGIRSGCLESRTDWREVESAIEIESWVSEADGSVRLMVTPEFSYLSGRSRRSVAFQGERAEIHLPPGVEVRFAPGAALGAFYRRLLSGYDPLRRVWPVDLLLRADLLESAGP